MENKNNNSILTKRYQVKIKKKSNFITKIAKTLQDQERIYCIENPNNKEPTNSKN